MQAIKIRGGSMMRNRYPIFIPSKGRWKHRYTIDMFDEFGFDYHVVVEPQEYDNYANVVDSDKLLVLPFSNKGLTKTRNWIWDYAESLGVEKFWTFDDNINGIYRFNNNLRVRCSTGVPIPIIENFSDRFENVSLTGMNYFMFIYRKIKKPPFRVNSRVYSNMLLNTKEKNPDGTPFRNKLEFNDDTDLNIRILKMGKCIIQFNAFCIYKLNTMTVKGGIKDSYDKMTDNRKAISEMLVNEHPDVAKLVWKFNRWHHEVDYKSIGRHTLKMKQGLNIPKGVNNYGMKLVELNYD